MAVAHAGVWVLAAAAQGRMALGRPVLDLLGAMVWKSVIVSAIVAGAGLCGVLNGWGLLAGGVVAGGLGAALGGVGVLRGVAQRVRGIIRELWTTERGPAFLALEVCGLVLLRHAMNMWWFAPYTGDESTYHLPKLVTWIQSGQLQFPELADPRGAFPGGMQLLHAWWVGFLRHDLLIEGAGVEMALLLAVAAAALARACGVPRGGACLAAALALSAPAALVHATSAMNDVAAAGCIAGCFALVLRPVRPAAAWTVALALFALGVGIKPVVGFALPGLLLTAYLARPAVPGWRPPRAALVLGALALGVGSLWYAWNAARHGNPLHPVSLAPRASALKVESADSQLSTGPSAAAAFRSAGAILGPRLFSIHSRLTPACAGATGWGWTLAIAGGPCLLWALWRRPAWRAPTAGGAVAFLAILACVEADPYNARFVLWVPALLGGACAAAAAASPHPSLATGVLLAGAAANLLQTAVPPVYSPPHTLRAILTTPWRARDTVSQFESRYRPQGTAAEKRAQVEAMEGSEPVFVIGVGGPGATLARGDYRRRLAFGRPADPVAAMKARGTPVLHIWAAGRETEVAVAEAEARGDLVRIAPRWYRLAEPPR